MKKFHHYAIWGAIIVAVVLAFFFISGGESSSESGRYDNFAQCLTDSGAVMYGAYWCGHCQNQKEMFGNSWSKVNYVECDPRGDGANPGLCEEKGITGYPTWIFGNGERVSGARPLSVLAAQTGCELP